MSAFWCELAWLGDERVAEGVLIEADGELITSVAASETAPAGATVLSGLTMPAFANAHSHSFQRALRGRTQAANHGSFWTWRERMYALAERLDSAEVEALARATFAEMTLAGVGLVGEFDYLHESEALMRAAADAGLRMTLIDACYLEGGLPRFQDVSAEAWAERVGGLTPRGQVRLGAAIHSVRAVDPSGAAVVAGLATERGWPLHAHVSEQPRENEECLRRYGRTPLGLLREAGALSPRFTAVHATHLSDDDVALLRDTGGFCCLCPTTERDLADGIGRPHARLTLGSDSQAVIDLLEEARAVELDERLVTLVRGTHGPDELAGALTGNGYDSLGWPEGGRIAEGALCDLVSIRLDGVRLAGTTAQSALEAVVFAGAAGDVHSLCVGGRVVVRDGRHVELDVAAELATAIGALG